MSPTREDVGDALSNVTDSVKHAGGTVTAAVGSAKGTASSALDTALETALDSVSTALDSVNKATGRSKKKSGGKTFLLLAVSAAVLAAVAVAVRQALGGRSVPDEPVSYPAPKSAASKSSTKSSPAKITDSTPSEHDSVADAQALPDTNASGE